MLSYKYLVVFNICIVVDLLFCFFFFKQKTAYEMRISDWSSDVCSSDLQQWPPRWRGSLQDDWCRRRCGGRRSPSAACRRSAGRAWQHSRAGARCTLRWRRDPPSRCSPSSRSEEHTSELQSLMRRAYAVYCLTKKTQQTTNTTQTSHTTRTTTRHT